MPSLVCTATRGLDPKCVNLVKICGQATRAVLRSNWPKLYQAPTKFTSGEHTIRIPVAELSPFDDRFEIKNTPAVDPDHVSDRWFVKLYVGNSVMQMLSRHTASVELVVSTAQST